MAIEIKVNNLAVFATRYGDIYVNHADRCIFVEHRLHREAFTDINDEVKAAVTQFNTAIDILCLTLMRQVKTTSFDVSDFSRFAQNMIEGVYETYLPDPIKTGTFAKQVASQPTWITPKIPGLNWDEMPQYYLGVIQWENAVKISKLTGRECRLTTTRGYNGPGHYINPK